MIRGEGNGLILDWSGDYKDKRSCEKLLKLSSYDIS